MTQPRIAGTFSYGVTTRNMGKAITTIMRITANTIPHFVSHLDFPFLETVHQINFGCRRCKYRSMLKPPQVTGTAKSAKASD